MQKLVSVSLNGTKVTRRNGTIFIPLPKREWLSQVNPKVPCVCGKCNGDGAFDTLAVAEPLFAEVGLPGNSFTWMVHYPELRKDAK